MPQIMNSKDKRNPNYSGGNSGEEEDSWMNSYYTCLVCMQTAESPRVSFCGHHFCSQCIYNWIRSQKYQAKCPYCQSLIGENTLITIRHAKTKNVLSCKSFVEHRRQMRMSKDCLTENIFCRRPACSHVAISNIRRTLCQGSSLCRPRCFNSGHVIP